MKNGSKPLLAEEVHILSEEESVISAYILAFLDSRGELKKWWLLIRMKFALASFYYVFFVGAWSTPFRMCPILWILGFGSDLSLALWVTAVTSRIRYKLFHIFTKMSISLIVTQAFNFSYHFSLFYFFVEWLLCLFWAYLAKVNYLCFCDSFR